MIQGIMSIFTQECYRSILKGVIQSQKNLDKSVNYASLASKTRVQAPYFSKVLNGHTDFNSDQLYSCCQSLGMEEEETDYMLLLLERERSTSTERKKVLSTKIKKLRFLHSDASKQRSPNTTFIENNLSNQELAEYYLEPYCLIIHMLLLIPKYQKNYKLISTHLNITEFRLSKVMQKLVRLKIINHKDGKITVNERNLHLQRDSELIDSHQSLIFNESIAHKNNLPIDKKKSLTLTFTADEDTKQKITNELNSMMSRISEIQGESNPEACFQLNLDFFKWD